ncbi:MAG: ParB/RepB/Spo0J family partition protein, partial [Candidatus Bathyarchaeia archaeon]
GVPLSVDFREINLDELRPTETFLEKDKLSLVFQRIMEEDYRVPIIAVEQGGQYFIIDGHHRSFIYKKLGKGTIQAYVISLPPVSLRPRVASSLDEIPIKDVGEIDDPILATWGQILFLLKYYEAIYSTPFIMKKEMVPLDSLVPTQPLIEETRLDSIREILVPVVGLRHNDQVYILDGHVRTLFAKRKGKHSIQAIILVPSKPVDYGVVKAAEKMGLKSLDDIKILP